MIWPGFAFASTISSFTLDTGTDGCATSRLWLMTSSTTGAKSFARSHEMVFAKVLLIAVAALATSSV